MPKLSLLHMYKAAYMLILLHILWASWISHSNYILNPVVNSSCQPPVVLLTVLQNWKLLLSSQFLNTLVQACWNLSSYSSLLQRSPQITFWKKKENESPFITFNVKARSFQSSVRSVILFPRLLSAMQSLDLSGADTLPWKNAWPPGASKESLGEGQVMFFGHTWSRTKTVNWLS